MKIGFNPGSIVNANGAPLQGRVIVYVHDGLEKKSIYTMEGSDYVASENPVLLDTTGRIPTTLFFDVCVVDVLVQKYVGEPGHLADDSPDEDFEDFDRFEAGFDFDPEKEASRTVETIADLKDIENPSGVVRVNCYTTPGDTFPRYYLWNPNCTASEDGGCVIADTHDASGMWCYLCEGDSIKSSVYGIKPGTEETNLGAFCAAPLGVSGDYTITYPASLYFERGEYSQTTTSIVATNNRTAIFSCGAKFPTATIIAYDVDVDGVCLNHDYIADFVIPQSQYENSATIRSSWCRSLDGFWRSGAKHLILDRNHLSNGVITSKIDVSEAVIEGVYFTPTYTFSTGAYLNFDKCHFVGAKWIFQEDNFLKFSGCNFSDDMFWSVNPNSVDFGEISQGHHIEVDNWKITDSFNANVWLAWQATKASTTIDLCGRVVNNITNEKLREIDNGVVTGGIRVKSTMTLRNVSGNPGVYNGTVNSGTVRIIDSVATINSGATFDSIYAQNSDVSASTIDTTTTSYTQRGGSFTGTFVCPGYNINDGQPGKGKAVYLEGVTANITNFSWFSDLTLQNCNIAGQVHVIPYGDNGTLYIKFDARNTVFHGGVLFGTSSIVGGNGYVYDIDIDTLNIVSCDFKNNLVMPYKNTDFTHNYLSGYGSSNYNGNIGQCPGVSLSGTFDESATYTEGSGTYKYSHDSVSFWNVSSNDVDEFGNGVAVNMSGADIGKAKAVKPYYVHSYADDATNDQFSVRRAINVNDYDSSATIIISD